MQFLNLTREIGIGANSYLLEIAGKRLVLDCGLHPRLEGFEALPELAALDDDSVDGVILSHAHQDHVGSIPVLLRRHPRARLFTTEVTRQIADVMLHNSVNVMLRIREARGLSSYPLFTHKEVEITGRRWQGVPLGQRWSLEGERLSLREAEEMLHFEFFDAGHILGSVGTMIRGEGRTVFYTGDVNFENQTLSQGAAFPDGPVDVLVVETTRGDQPTPEGFTRRSEEARLATALRDAFERGGAVLIPTFALGKTQELLAMLAGMEERGEIPFGLPVYIGGLSAKLTDLYDKLSGQWPRQRPGLKLRDAVEPFVVGGREINELQLRPRRLYALTSGMMTEKTLSNLFADRIISNPAHHLFFIGYADPESPGGRIKAAAPGDLVQLEAGEPPSPLACHVEDFNFSAHASRETLRSWIARVQPKKVLLVHGDPSAIDWFARAIAEDLPETEVIIPEPGRRYDL
ncbi:MAG TPA: MBL fold metallo-hydrolase [Chthoniobacteraceae bacterium]|nr:MBL fold metallo-hydrolase [Chthoniobacteraceae bacterium]